MSINLRSQTSIQEKFKKINSKNVYLTGQNICKTNQNLKPRPLKSTRKRHCSDNSERRCYPRHMRPYPTTCEFYFPNETQKYDFENNNFCQDTDDYCQNDGMCLDECVHGWGSGSGNYQHVESNIFDMESNIFDMECEYDNI